MTSYFKTDESNRMPITNSTYKALRADAIEHGDEAQAELCTLAIDGDHVAQRKCDKVIMDARALNDVE